MRNKIITIILCITLTASIWFTACGNIENRTEEPNQEEPKVEEQEQEEPKQEESEPEETEEPTPEPDKPLDIEANEKLKDAMTTLAGVGHYYDYKYDFNLTFINELYAMNKNAITSFICYLGGVSGTPEGGRDEEMALFSVGQVQEIMRSLVGHEVDLRALSDDNGWIEVDMLRGDGFYVDCQNWNTEYIGNNTWKVYTDLYAFSPGSDGYIKIAEVNFTVIENPDSIFDGCSITEMEAAQPTMSEWAKAFYDYILENYNNISSRDFAYFLIYLDSDNIPEIYVHTFVNNYVLLYYSDGQVKEKYLASDYAWYQYIPQSGLLMEEFFYVHLSNAVSQLKNGEFIDLVVGIGQLKQEYEKEAGIQGESWMYDYSVNGEAASEEEYNRRLNEVFDPSKAIQLWYDEDNALDLYSLLGYLTSLEASE